MYMDVRMDMKESVCMCKGEREGKDGEIDEPSASRLMRREQDPALYTAAVPVSSPTSVPLADSMFGRLRRSAAQALCHLL